MSALDEAKKKGLSIVAVRDFVNVRYGTDTWGRVLASLPGADGRTVREALGVGWYSLGLYARLLRAVDTEIGQGDLRAIRPITRFEAERDVPTIHRLLLRLTNPAYVLEKMADLWPRYHTTGRLSFERQGRDRLKAMITDWGVDVALCTGFQGYSERALELAGARDVRMLHPACRARGAEACVFRASWRD